MTHFLDKLPFDLQDPAARDLWTLLADNYYTRSRVVTVLQQAGVSPSDVNLELSMREVWADILRVSRAQDKLRPLLDVIAASGDAAVAARLQELVSPSPVVAVPAPTLAGDWGADDDSGAVERIIGQSTLLDIAFLRRGIELATGVCRLTVTMSGNRYYGTGFLIADKLVLTNHHVLFDHDNGNQMATAVEAWFGYEVSLSGLPAEHTVISADPQSIRGAADHDWAIVTLAEAPTGAAVIDLTPGAVKVDDRVYIIQPPSGSPKKIGMIHNEVRHVDANVVQYLTDTEVGSSGSPVFNEQWQLVALHHRWVDASASGRTEYRNQGRRIERVVEGLQAVGAP